MSKQVILKLWRRHLWRLTMFDQSFLVCTLLINYLDSNGNHWIKNLLEVMCDCRSSQIGLVLAIYSLEVWSELYQPWNYCTCCLIVLPFCEIVKFHHIICSNSGASLVKLVYSRFVVSRLGYWLSEFIFNFFWQTGSMFLQLKMHL
jgi:hypothetical protein